MKEIKHLILDMDGVLWHGETPLERLPEFFKTLDQLGIRYLFATNNASKTPDQYVQKFGRFGVSITAEQVMSSALATAAYLSQAYNPAETTVYMVGDDGLYNALTAAGFTVLDRDDHQSTADLVTVGLNRKVTYDDLAFATVHIRRGARFIGCNPDVTFPSELGLLPGNGSLLALISAATDVQPTIIGKPGTIMFQECVRRLGEEATGHNTAMIGDRLNTDIAGGHNAGLQTILVLSGVSKREEIVNSDVQPDYVFADIHELARALKNGQQ